MECSSNSIFIVIAFILVIVLINSIVKQQTVSELVNNVSMGMLSARLDKNSEEEGQELYRDLPDGTKLILEDGKTIVAPPNSRLVETRNDIILQMNNGDLFIVPDGTTISVPQFGLQQEPDQVAKATITKAEATVAPAGEVEGVKSTFVGGREAFNNDLDEEDKPVELTADYSADLVKMGIEKSVRQQHTDYAKDRNRVTNTASLASVRDDSQDINPRVGLRRINYSDIHMDQKTARTLPSEINADELSKPNHLLWQ
jgi:hypothetical protein